MNLFKFFGYLIIFLMILGCNNLQKNSAVLEADNFELDGLFQGTQDAYNLKNKFGDDIIIQGNRVTVPSSKYKFLFQEGFKVSLQQTSEEGQIVHYEGNYQISRNDDKIILIECELTDGEYSNPTMNIEYSKSNNEFTFKGQDGSPDFNLVNLN